jgi:hypothetical protein
LFLSRPDFVGTSEGPLSSLGDGADTESSNDQIDLGNARQYTRPSLGPRYPLQVLAPSHGHFCCGLFASIAIALMEKDYPSKITRHKLSSEVIDILNWLSN